jgi:hypothetical protein
VLVQLLPPSRLQLSIDATRLSIDGAIYLLRQLSIKATIHLLTQSLINAIAGVEVLPIGNAMLNDDDLSYYQAFVAHGVALFVGPSRFIR